MTCPELIFSITFCQSSLWPLFSAETPFPQRWKSTFVLILFIVVVPSLSRVWFLATPWTAAHQAPLSSTLSQGLLKFMSIESVMLSNSWSSAAPFLLPSIFPRIRVFSNESALCISGQSTGASVSATVLPVNIQGWLPLGLAGLISLLLIKNYIFFSFVEMCNRCFLIHQLSKLDASTIF